MIAPTITKPMYTQVIIVQMLVHGVFFVVLGPQRLEGFGMIQRSTFPRL